MGHSVVVRPIAMVVEKAMVRVAPQTVAQQKQQIIATVQLLGWRLATEVVAEGRSVEATADEREIRQCKTAMACSEHPR